MSRSVTMPTKRSLFPPELRRCYTFAWFCDRRNGRVGRNPLYALMHHLFHLHWVSLLNLFESRPCKPVNTVTGVSFGSIAQPFTAKGVRRMIMKSFRRRRGYCTKVQLCGDRKPGGTAKFCCCRARRSRRCLRQINAMADEKGKLMRSFMSIA